MVQVSAVLRIVKKTTGGKLWNKPWYFLPFLHTEICKILANQVSTCQIEASKSIAGSSIFPVASIILRGISTLSLLITVEFTIGLR